MKETQGHKKMVQRIEDLIRNKHFLKALKRYQKLQKESDKTFTPEHWTKIYERYVELADIVRRTFKKSWKDYEKILEKMAEQYGLDSNLLGYIILNQDKYLSNLNPYQDYLDMCFWEDGKDEFLRSPFDEVPLVFDPTRTNRWKAYPLSLRIHMYATKRDVLDYVEKNWERMYEALGIYTDYKKVVIRKRKTNRAVVDFIWSNKHLKGKEIKKLLDEKFPKNSITYYEIPKIIGIEREKRLRF